MKRLETIMSMLFGGIFVVLSLMVAAETMLRKLFGASLQGVDELGGYALAVGATLAFSMALFGRAHMRIDIFHERLPRMLQAILNWLSALLMAVFALVLLWNCLQVVNETMEYGSTAQTPWATPLQYPQTAWLIGIALFGLLATGYAIRASWLLVANRIDELNVEFHPKGVNEEIKEELEDFEHRVQEASHTFKEELEEVTHHQGIERDLSDEIARVTRPANAATTGGISQ
ncbi:MAG: TRAP transporter small permease [Motiliproteus sp.]